MVSRATMMPCLRYADAPAAIAFLCAAFGFHVHAVFADPDDPAVIHHAQLVLGDAMVMLASARADEAQDRYRFMTPAEAGGVTMSLYVIVVDADAHHARASTAGAEIVDPPHDNVGYAGRSYHARDPEGNDWDFGTYDPWET